MAMMGSLGPLFAGLMGRGAAPPSPTPMSPVMGSQIASMFGGGGAPRQGPMGTIANRMVGQGVPAGGGGFSRAMPTGNPMSVPRMGMSLPTQAKAFGARRRFS